MSKSYVDILDVIRSHVLGKKEETSYSRDEIRDMLPDRGDRGPDELVSIRQRMEELTGNKPTAESSATSGSSGKVFMNGVKKISETFRNGITAASDKIAESRAAEAASIVSDTSSGIDTQYEG